MINEMVMYKVVASSSSSDEWSGEDWSYSGSDVSDSTVAQVARKKTKKKGRDQLNKLLNSRSIFSEDGGVDKTNVTTLLESVKKRLKNPKIVHLGPDVLAGKVVVDDKLHTEFEEAKADFNAILVLYNNKGKRQEEVCLQDGSVLLRGENTKMSNDEKRLKGISEEVDPVSVKVFYFAVLKRLELYLSALQAQGNPVDDCLAYVKAEALKEVPNQQFFAWRKGLRDDRPRVLADFQVLNALLKQLTGWSKAQAPEPGGNLGTAVQVALRSGNPSSVAVKEMGPLYFSILKKDAEFEQFNNPAGHKLLWSIVKYLLAKMCSDETTKGILQFIGIIPGNRAESGASAGASSDVSGIIAALNKIKASFPSGADQLDAFISHLEMKTGDSSNLSRLIPTLFKSVSSILSVETIKSKASPKEGGRRLSLFSLSKKSGATVDTPNIDPQLNELKGRKLDKLKEAIKTYDQSQSSHSVKSVLKYISEVSLDQQWKDYKDVLNAINLFVLRLVLYVKSSKTGFSKFSTLFPELDPGFVDSLSTHSLALDIVATIDYLEKHSKAKAAELGEFPAPSRLGLSTFT